MRRLALLILILAAFAGTVLEAQEADYLLDIKPVLKARCYACHGALKQEAGLRLDTGQLARQGGRDGAVINLDAPESSELWRRIVSTDLAERMPPEGEPLSAIQLEHINKWLHQSAPSPANELPEPDPSRHWAFLRPVRTPLNNIQRQASSNGNPIDAYLGLVHERHQMTPLPPVPAEVWLRRVYLDLVGVLPTQQQLSDFLVDPSQDARQKVIDRLLSSPMYGERWARHWMDVWRYSDWYGRRHVPDVWNSAPQIWRWRDWIVRSLNDDKGYDQMLTEMLAADEYSPEDSQAAVATGYIIRNWYALNPNEWMRSTVEHTGKAFLGLTFNCAHCHDHKYDPIAQDDYFRLRAFFEPIYVRQDRVEGEPDPGPFQDYDYSVLRKVQRLGLVRIFDKTPDAATWFYTGGDERNRVTERGSIKPGVPDFLAQAGQPIIQAVQLPATAWYPGLNEQIQATARQASRQALLQAESLLVAAQQREQAPAPADVQALQVAEHALVEARQQALATGSPALEGRQSVLLDATQGRRLLANRLQQLKLFPENLTLRFMLRIEHDAHFNFQLLKDVVKGLTASYVGFKQGRLLAYRPGTTEEFEIGRYQPDQVRQFAVQLVLQPSLDQCQLTVRSLDTQQTLVDGVAISLNGWNPLNNNQVAIAFDAQSGTVAAIDAVALHGGDSADAELLARFDFESPKYVEGKDCLGIENWENTAFSQTPATSQVVTLLGCPEVRQAEAKVSAARQRVRAATIERLAATARRDAAQAELDSLEARIAADNVAYRSRAQTSNALQQAAPENATQLARQASRSERQAAVLRYSADFLSGEEDLVKAGALPESDKERAKKIAAAQKKMVDAQQALFKAEQLAADMQTETYTPLSPKYPETSTGRRLALANWMTSAENPLTARVAINHIWAWHFHAPLVSSVFDFGRNGATPTHPELLDALAVELQRNHWSMKHIHRLIVSSDAYARASSAPPTAMVVDQQQRDPENRWLWRMNTGRMDAEVVRDSLLSLAGELDLQMTGQELENSEALTTFRRSLYYSVFPEDGGRSAIGELFDGPDAAECYRRSRSVVPQQALALTNSELVHRISQVVVRRWEPSSVQGKIDSTQLNVLFIRDMWQQILSRQPSAAELEVCVHALGDYPSSSANTADRAAVNLARESLVRALLNHNDFLTIR